MSWIGDLASGLGIPHGAAVLAVAMFGACVAAEKAARPEALRDITRILKDRSWERSVRPSAVIEKVFKWTFGERQFGLRCIQRSLIMSIVALTVLLIIFLHEGGRATGKGTPFLAAIAGILTLAIPDYVALGKTRILLNWYEHSVQAVGPVAIILLDFLASAAISLVTLYLFQLVLFRELPTASAMRLIYEGLRFMVGLGPQPDPMPIYVMFLISTTFTTIWTLLILFSTAVVKLASPVHRLTAWYFDLDKHPMRAIGIVSGALIMAGSVIWAGLRAVI
jgi:hypothetical protein